MRILISANTAWNIRNFRMPVVRALRGRGHEVILLTPPDDTVPGLVAQGLRHIPLAMDGKGLNPLRDAALIARLHRIFRREAPDLVLSFTIKNNLYGALAAERLRLPFVPNVSGLGTAFISGAPLRLLAETLYRRAFRRLDTVFFQNGDDRDLFLGRGLVRPAQARLLPGSGIDLDRFRPAPPAPGAPAFLMIARLLRDKGVMEYVEAARALRETHPAVRFRLLGAADAENRSAIGLSTVREWESEGVIDYLGTTDDVRPAIAAAACVVLPSYREGAPRTLIEAAAMSRPLIATDVPGCRAVVEDGRTGLLCAPRSGEALAEACRRVLALPPEAAAAMGAAGRRKMEAEFDEARVVAAYLEAVERAAGRTRGPGRPS